MHSHTAVWQATYRYPRPQHVFTPRLVHVGVYEAAGCTCQLAFLRAVMCCRSLQQFHQVTDSGATFRHSRARASRGQLFLLGEVWQSRMGGSTCVAGSYNSFIRPQTAEHHFAIGVPGASHTMVWRATCQRVRSTAVCRFFLLFARCRVPRCVKQERKHQRLLTSRPGVVREPWFDFHIEILSTSVQITEQCAMPQRPEFELLGGELGLFRFVCPSILPVKVIVCQIVDRKARPRSLKLDATGL